MPDFPEQTGYSPEQGPAEQGAAFTDQPSEFHPEPARTFEQPPVRHEGEPLEPVDERRAALHDNGWRPPASFDEPEPRTEPRTSAAERLRAAEDHLLGKDVATHDGRPERGAGSRFAALHPAHKAHLAAIEHLIAVEAEHAEAEARLTAVHARVEHAIARVEATEEASANVEKEPAR